MKEFPILFSGEMIRALLNTRVGSWPPEPIDPAKPCKGVTRRMSKQWLRRKKGDVLYARETFWAKHDYELGDYGTVYSNAPCLDLGKEHHPGWDYCATPECFDPPALTGHQSVFPHKGDPVPGDWWLGPPEHWNGDDDYRDVGQWQFNPWDERFYTKHPSIHMPRWMSRIRIELLEDPREERLQEITEEDARLEGVEKSRCGQAGYAMEPVYSYRTGFVRIWSTLHTKPGERWEDNRELVRVGGFRRIA